MRPKLLDRLRTLSLGYGIAFIMLLAIVAVSLFSNRAAIFSLVASSASSTRTSDPIIFFAPRGPDTLTVGETAQVDIRINAPLPINAVGATVHFLPEMLEIVGVSKEFSFLDLWTEETVIREDSGEVHFSGGTLTKGGVTEVATILTLTVRAKKPGRTELSFKDSEIFAHDGKGLPLQNERRSFAYTIVEPPIETPVAVRTAARAKIETIYIPSGDFNNDGTTSFADISILAIQLLASYNPRFDLDRDGTINLRDLSIIFAKARE